MKKILGLDLGTNSIGWALVEQNFDEKQGKILGLGSRIIPMSQDVMDAFGGGGQIQTGAANRTLARSTRKLYQRDNLRRERIHRVLNILGFLPEHYKSQIDFNTHKGQFINGAEPKLPYCINAYGKFEFLFKLSFEEMAEEFKLQHPELFENGKKIPYDWTIYFLRKKALEYKISKEELSWVILNFNQKRGYYQLSEESGANDDKIQTYEVLKVKEVIDTGETIKGKNDKLHEVYFENGWKYDKQIVKIGDWIDKTKEFIVTESIVKNGEIKRTFKAVDSEKDWIAIKQKTEQFIEKSGKTVGQNIYDTLLKNPTQKINGKLIRTIERKFYREELALILSKQIEFHPELQNEDLYKASILELYPYNEAHRNNIANRRFDYLFNSDIIFYQRPLKSKVSLISECSLEYRLRKDTGEKVYIKCIARSNPLFQEFRLWQFICNLKIYEREKIVNSRTRFDVNVTEEYLFTNEKWIELFGFLNDKESVTQKQLLAYFKLKEDKFRWNYVEGKEYPCNETRSKFINRIKKNEGIDKGFFNVNNTQHLWHILYSVTDPEQRKSAIARFALKHQLSADFTESFSKFPPFKREYGSFSEKAIKKLLPLIRVGEYWSFDNIDEMTKNRIGKIISGEYDENIKLRVRENAFNLQQKENFQKLTLWLASYIVYNRHSESADTIKWKTAQDIADYLNPRLKASFKQHSLRNPIVEQVITETLRVVKDIWTEFGKGEENFFDEIHIELGRDMKNDKKTRERISNQVTENENTNQRIKEILKELMNEGIDVKPYSPSHQEILKIYEEGIYHNESKKDQLDLIDKIRKSNSPSIADIQRYKLWLEQGYVSPYTKKTIQLSELFTPKYQIEHIFPQARYFDDSLSNKVICEAEVNQLKDNRTALEFIIEFGGTKVEIGNGREVEILKMNDYEGHIKAYFGKNKAKREKLLSVDIPDSFINRQMNDSRYISKAVKTLLSNIVREDNEQEVTSKNIVTITGSITSKMKQDWGLNDIWNDIITPRFKRMNQITNSNNFGSINPNTNKFLPTVPDGISKGFSKKRIDHRHHALDALVIACLTKDHVSYITSINTERKNYSLVPKLRKIEEINKNIIDSHGNKSVEKRKIAADFLKPWQTFTQDVGEKLETTIVSFKQNNRIINKTKNKHWKWEQEEGQIKKNLVSQTKGDNWAIRKPLHTPLPYGKRNYDFSVLEICKNVGQRNYIIDEELKVKVIDTFELNGKKVGNTEKYLKKNPIIDNDGTEITFTSFSVAETRYRKRQPITKLANRGLGGVKTKEQAVSLINKVSDKLIRIDLLNHLKSNNNDIDQAFSIEGIARFNSSRKIPVYKLPISEASDLKFPLGYKPNTFKKFGEAESGTNLFFAVYRNEIKQKREFETIPLNVVIEHQKLIAHLPKEQRTSVPINKGKGNFLFSLSPNDLVYLPTVEEQENSTLVDFNSLSKEQTNRVYKMVSSSGNQCFFVRNDVSTTIQNKIEFSALNKTERSIDDLMIKDTCWKLIVNRLGMIIKVVKD